MRQLKVIACMLALSNGLDWLVDQYVLDWLVDQYDPGLALVDQYVLDWLVDQDVRQ